MCDRTHKPPLAFFCIATTSEFLYNLWNTFIINVLIPVYIFMFEMSSYVIGQNLLPALVFQYCISLSWCWFQVWRTVAVRNDQFLFTTREPANFAIVLKYGCDSRVDFLWDFRETGGTNCGTGGINHIFLNLACWTVT